MGLQGLAFLLVLLLYSQPALLPRAPALTHAPCAAPRQGTLDARRRARTAVRGQRDAQAVWGDGGAVPGAGIVRHTRILRTRTRPNDAAQMAHTQSGVEGGAWPGLQLLPLSLHPESLGYAAETEALCPPS